MSEHARRYRAVWLDGIAIQHLNDRGVIHQIREGLSHVNVLEEVVRDRRAVHRVRRGGVYVEVERREDEIEGRASLDDHDVGITCDLRFVAWRQVYCVRISS